MFELRIMIQFKFKEQELDLNKEFYNITFQSLILEFDDDETEE